MCVNRDIIVLVFFFFFFSFQSAGLPPRDRCYCFKTGAAAFDIHDQTLPTAETPRVNRPRFYHGCDVAVVMPPGLIFLAIVAPASLL